MAPRKGVVYCKDVASKLGIQPHNCKRRFFLDKKNRCRHKLRSFSLQNKEHQQYLHNIFSIHPSISRSTRSPLDKRITSLFGGHNFELCDNLRYKIEAILNKSKESASTATAENRTDDFIPKKKTRSWESNYKPRSTGSISHI